MTEDDIAHLLWAIDQAGISAGEAVRRVLTGDTDKPVNSQSTPGAVSRQADRPASQMDRLADLVSGEYEVRAQDVVTYGITDSIHTARQLLANLVAEGRIDRVGRGVYAPKGAAAEMGS